MKSNFIAKIIGASLAIAMMIGGAVGINATKQAKEVNAADTTISSGTVVSGTGYKEHKNNSWIITFGGNNASIGTNSNNRSKCNLSSQSKYAVSPVTTSDTASAFVSLTSLNDINGITYTFNGGSNQTATKVYAIYSSNNTTFAALSLTSGTQGHTISTNTTLEFATCSGYFGLLFQATNDSGNWRIDNVNLTFHEDSNTAPAVTSIAMKTAPTKTAYWPGENFDPAGLSITLTYDNADSVDIAYSNETKDDFLCSPTTITEAGNVEIQYKTYSEMKVTQAVTLVTPLTVAEAKNAIDSAQGNVVQNAYVQGKISQIDSYDDEHHSITYWISDDGTTTNQFEVYGGKGLNKAAFSSIEEIELGATVVVFGIIKLYNNTVYEFASGNYLKSYTEPVKTLVSIFLAGNFPTSFFVNEEFSHAGMIVKAKYDNNSTKDVTEQATFSSPAMAQARRQVVTVTYTEGGVTKTATYRIIVRTRITDQFDKFTGNTVTDGDYVIYYDGVILENTISDNRAGYVEKTIDGLTYYATDNNLIWRIAKDGDYYTIYNARADKYLAATGSKNQAALIDDKTDDKAKWTISSPSAGT